MKNDFQKRFFQFQIVRRETISEPFIVRDGWTRVSIADKEET